jgi:hypothetical protein
VARLSINHSVFRAPKIAIKRIFYITDEDNPGSLAGPASKRLEVGRSSAKVSVLIRTFRTSLPKALLSCPSLSAPKINLSTCITSMLWVLLLSLMLVDVDFAMNLTMSRVSWLPVVMTRILCYPTTFAKVSSKSSPRCEFVKCPSARCGASQWRSQTASLSESKGPPSRLKSL